MSTRTLRPFCVQLLPATHAAGAENQARYFTQALHRSGRFDVELAYFEPGRAHSAFEATGAALRRFERRHRFRFDLLLRSRRIQRAYQDRPPDIFHTWLLEANLFGLLAARAWPRTGLVISQRGSWNELDYPHHLRLQRMLKGRADHAVSNSPGGAEVLARIGVPRDRISVIPNGISEERVQVAEPRATLRTRLGWAGRDVVAWVGRAEDPPALAQKDFATLLAAISRVRTLRPNTHLALIGLTAESASRGGFRLPPWVQPLGWVERAPDYLNAADLLAISSRAEGHSNAAAEALLLGLPVATTACGGHCELVKRASGRVTPIGDPGALANAAEGLLANPPNREAVREAVRDELSVDRMVERTLSVYERVMSQRGTRGGSGAALMNFKA